MRILIAIFVAFTFSACSGGGGGSSSTPIPGPGPGPGDGRLPNPDQFKFPIHSDACIKSFFAVSDWQEELARQIKFGDAPCVKKVLQLGAKVNEPVNAATWGRDLVPPIHYALTDSALFFSKSKDLGIGVIKALVEAGADVNAKDSAGRTALWVALSPEILKDYVNPAAYLIQSKKADLEARFQRSDTPLLDLLRRKEQKLVELLISQGANIHARTSEGVTTLQYAIKGDMEPIALTLLAKGVDPAAPDLSGNTALHNSALEKMEKLSKAIIDQFSVEVLNARNRDRETALLLATRMNVSATVRALLDKGADANLASDRELPLHAALRAGFDELITLLIPKTANLNQPDSRKDTPLHLAVERASAAQVKALLEHGVNANVVNSENLTPLMLALVAKDAGKVGVLIPRSNVDLKGSKGQTALFHAQTQNDIRALRAAGANLNVKDEEGKTPVAHFIHSNKTDVANELIAAGADLSWQHPINRSTLLHIAIEKDNVALAETLITQGLKANALDSLNRNPVFFASSVAAINLLTRNGANVNQASSLNTTPLLLQVQGYVKAGGRQYAPIVQRLIELGADVNVSDDEGKSLLHLAVGYVAWRIDVDFTYYPELVKLLLERGAKVNALDQQMNSPLHVADTEVEVRLLLEAGAKRDLKNIERKTALQLNEGQQVVFKRDVDRLLLRIPDLEERLGKATDQMVRQLLERQIQELRTDLVIRNKRLDMLNRILALLRQ